MDNRTGHNDLAGRLEVHLCSTDAKWEAIFSSSLVFCRLVPCKSRCASGHSRHNSKFQYNDRCVVACLLFLVTVGGW